ncbi:MAG: ThiF family adenylyltransferase, partial [Candidatus Brocadiales bacterium]
MLIEWLEKKEKKKEGKKKMYERQDLLPLCIPPSVSVVGCGGAGTWVAIFAAMSGVTRLAVFDSDAVESSNLNRLPYTTKDVGRPKTEVLREFIGRIRPECAVLTYPHMNEVNLGLLDGLVADCTDNIDVQRMLYKHCKETGARYVGVHVDGETIQINEKVPLFGPKDDATGYTVTPSWVVPTALVGAFGLVGMLVDRYSISGRLRELGTEAEVYSNGFRDGKVVREEEMEEAFDRRCDYCDRIRPDDSDYGYCPDCERINPEDSEYGYCPDCERICQEDADSYCSHTSDWRREREGFIIENVFWR